MMTYDFTSAENKVIIHINQGLILGDYNNDRTRLLAKTFVSKEMLFDSQVSVDNVVAEMRDLIKKSAEYNASPKAAFGIDELTGEVGEVSLF